MGLKTTNYVSKSTGIVLPEAYAVLTNLIVETDNRARAIFAVQASRKNAQSYQALDKVEVRFTWDRKTDPAKMAYEVAKTQEEERTHYKEDGTEEIVKVYGTLYGWENDIV
jgi:hypothetical protein